MKAKNWTALHIAQRTATLARKVDHYTTVISQIGEPQDRHQRRTLSMARRSLQAARNELLLLKAREGSAPKRVNLLQGAGTYVALFCTRSPKYGRPCATIAYRGCA